MRSVVTLRRAVSVEWVQETVEEIKLERVSRNFFKIFFFSVFCKWMEMRQ